VQEFRKSERNFLNDPVISHGDHWTFLRVLHHPSVVSVAEKAVESNMRSPWAKPDVFYGKH